MRCLPQIATLILIVSFWSATSRADPDKSESAIGTVRTGYGSLTTGSITGHLVFLELGVRVPLTHQWQWALRIPTIVVLVDEFSCCDVGVGNVEASLHWTQRSPDHSDTANLSLTIPTAFGKQNLVPAMRLAQRLELARDPDLYREQSLALSVSAGREFLWRNTWLAGEVGARQRLGWQSADLSGQTHLQLKASVRRKMAATTFEGSWRGSVPIIGSDVTFAHATSVSASRSLGSFDIAADVLVPLNRGHLKQRAFVVDLSLSKRF